MIYAGFLYMTSQGNMEQLKKARGMMVNAAIGLIIIFASYAITTFVVNSALQATIGAGSSNTSSSSAADDTGGGGGGAEEE